MTDDPRAPYYIVEEQYRHDIERLLKPLSNEQLDDIAALFHVSRLGEVPFRYWGVSYRVRAHIKQEQKRRKESAST